MENNTNIFSKRIKELRESLGMSQADFAKSVNTSQTTLSSYENTDKTPSLDIVKEIASKYNVSLDWLFGLSDTKQITSKLETYSELIEILLRITSCDKLEITLNTSKIYDDFNDTQYHQVANLSINDKIIVEFVSEWKDVMQLCKKSPSGQKLYAIWRKDVLERYTDKITFNPSENESDLPFF